MKTSLTIATVALVFSAILSLAPVDSTADATRVRARADAESPPAQANSKWSRRLGRHHRPHIAASGNSMDVHARPMKLMPDWPLPFGEANRPSLLEPILLLLFLVMIGSVLELL